MRIKTNSGFTLIELIVVIAILSILALISVASILGTVEEAKISADKATLRTLNNVTTMYKLESNNFDSDVFSGISEDENRILRLVDDGYLQNEISPQQNDASFQWEINDQTWRIYINNVIVPLSPLGSDFNEISTGMIAKILQKKNDTGSYGRSWGDFRYSDLGLDPEDWKEPIAHLNYMPSGSDLLINPEEGYRIKFQFNTGQTITGNRAYNIIFDTINEIWYYHKILPGNEIDIDTLQIVE